MAFFINEKYSNSFCGNVLLLLKLMIPIFSLKCVFLERDSIELAKLWTKFVSLFIMIDPSFANTSGRAPESPLFDSCFPAPGR